MSKKKCSKGFRLVKIISQHVDTLKFHYYISSSISDDSFVSYSKTVDSLLSLKKESQTLSNSYSDAKSVIKDFGSHNFRVMDKSVKGFSVVINNNDISIAFRKTKSKINPSPLLKVEFRAEFLARKGYKESIKIVNDFVSKYLLDSYEIKISEIHLASDIQGYNFSPLDYYRVKTRARNRVLYEEETEHSKASLYGGLTSFTGMSFGTGEYHLRIYNKTVEINKQKNKAFAKVLLWDNKPNYDHSKTVWRLEIQYRRSKLKKIVDSNSSTMDDYKTVLSSIPSLWNKAMEDYSFKNIHRDILSQMMDGVRVFKNGNERPFSKTAIYQVFKRSENLYFWDSLKKWNGHIPSRVDTAFKIPKSGSFEYVSNSIKSLYSTVAKHYGNVNTITLLDAFKNANINNLEKKQKSLLEDSFEKQLDWFERIEYMKMCGVLSVPDYKDLEMNIFQTVQKADEFIKNNQFTDDFKARISSLVYTSTNRISDVDNL